MEILEKALRMLEKYPLCDSCLGRQFAFLGYGLSNEERGRSLKLLLTMEAHRLILEKKSEGFHILKVLAENGGFSIAARILKKAGRTIGEEKECYLCKGIFKSLQELTDEVIRKLQNYEYNTFLVGVELPTDIEEREDEFKAEFGVSYSENMRNEFSREIGKKIVEATGKTVNHKKPEIVVLLNPFTKHIRFQANPLYIAGRYRKLVRGIPQAKWICTKCMGRGCEKCGWTGKIYPESVEELITKPILEETKGESASFHCAGREDVDARMLGDGRPFVVEIKKPRKRFINLERLAEIINKEAEGKVEVLNLKFVDKKFVRDIKKHEAARKLYRVIIKLDRELKPEELKKLQEALTDVTVLQQTPRRVLHRRADLIRAKHIYKVEARKIAPNQIEMEILCQGGLYIKELVTGDNGRTNPNVAGILKAEAKPIELDVLKVFI